MGRKPTAKPKSTASVLTAEEFRELHGKKKSLRKRSNKEINREMTESFLRQCKEAGLPNPLCEYRIYAVRKWRVDFLFARPRILAVEIEGFGHNKIIKFGKDMEKYNELTFSGIPLLRFTVKQVFSGFAVKQIKRLL